MNRAPGPTVQAVLETLFSLGRCSDRTKSYLAGEIAVLTGRTPRAAGITNWCNGNSFSPSNLPQLALRALGLDNYGFGTELWDMTPRDASQAVQLSVQNGIIGLLGGKQPASADRAPVYYYTERKVPFLGIVLPGEPLVNVNSLLPSPTNLLTIHGQEQVFAGISSALVGEVHIRVLQEDISKGKPTYYQINDLLGFADTISPPGPFDQGCLSLRHDAQDDCQQVSKIWTFVRSGPFPEPWLPGGVPARKRGDAGVEIDISRVESMLEHFRMSDPGHYAMSLTQVNYVAGSAES